MTRKAAERRLGVDIDCFRDPHDPKLFVAEANVESGAYSVCAATAAQAIDSLIATVYQSRSGIVRKRQRYRCIDCAEMKPLEVHHDTFRSQGGGHLLDNLIALCGRCHALRHSKAKAFRDAEAAGKADPEAR